MAPPDAEPTPPLDAEPAKPPPDAEPASSPAPADEEPKLSTDIITDQDLANALDIILETGATKKGLKFGGLSSDRATALLAKMEIKGIIGPAPKPGQKREILVTTWPPEAAPAEPSPAEPEPPPAEPPPAEPAPVEPAPPEPPPAEPAPGGEPAPEEPPPGTPPETPPETPETPPEAPPAPETSETKSRWESITSSFKSAYDRFMSKFRGEAQPEEEKDYKGSWGDIGRNTAWGLLGVGASYVGIKLGSDLLARAYQDLVSNPAERKRIHNALLTKETKLEEAINASKFLTKEKKAELHIKLKAIVDEYEKKDAALLDEKNRQVDELLKKVIQTRVKNTQLFKEGINTALACVFLASGGTAVWAQGLRGPGFSAVAIYERHKEVMQSPERRIQYWREMTVRGVTDTLKNLGGGDAKLLSKRGGLNAVKGATNVLRTVGFTNLTVEAFTGNSLMDYALGAWEKHMGIATPETPGGAGAGASPEAPGSPEAATAAGAAGAANVVVPGSPEAAGAAGTAGVAATESAPHVEIPEAKIETGLVKKGDGILKILERQGVEAKSALEAAREAGIVRAGGDTRLTTEAIGRLSVFAQTQPDGDIEIKFFDSETDKILTLHEAREAGFTYEHGTVPGEIPTDKEIVERVLEPTPDVEALMDSSAPNDLLGGTFHLYTDAEGHFTSLDPGNGDMLTRMNDAIQELARTGHGESPEAKFIFEQYTALLTSEGIEPVAELPPPEVAQRAVEEVHERAVAPPEISTVSEPLHIFRGESGRIKFLYDKETGEVIDASMPAYTPRPRDIKDSLREWGLTNREVKEHFFKGASHTHMDGTTIDSSHPGRYPGVERTGFPIQSPENDYRQFVRDAERLSRQESLLEEMEMEGYARTPEYARLKMETETLEKDVAGTMTRQFNIKERGI